MFRRKIRKMKLRNSLYTKKNLKLTISRSKCGGRFAHGFDMFSFATHFAPLQETLSVIQEDNEVGVTVKGSYYPPGKEPKEGERKLFLFIEATTEMALNRAKAEIVRAMKESMRAMVSSIFLQCTRFLYCRPPRDNRLCQRDVTKCYNIYMCVCVECVQ